MILGVQILRQKELALLRSVLNVALIRPLIGSAGLGLKGLPLWTNIERRGRIRDSYLLSVGESEIPFCDHFSVE